MGDWQPQEEPKFPGRKPGEPAPPQPNKELAEILPDAKPNLLELANELIYGERAKAYGPYDKNAERVSLLWNTYLNGRAIQPEDVAALLILLKLARLGEDPTHTDTWVDIAGYAGCNGKLRSIWP